MNSTGYPKVYEVGDTATYQGTARQILDVSQNNRTNCKCGGWCARLDLQGAGFVRACQVEEPADDASDAAMVEQIVANIESAADRPTAAPVTLTAQAGAYVVRFNVLESGAYRVEATTGHGGLVRYETAYGVDVLARSYAAQSTARSIARDMTILLRAGLSPAAVASLTIATDTNGDPR